MKCNKCGEEFDLMLANSGAGNTWHVYICPHCNWKHYTGWHFPDESIWQGAKDGKASIDFGPQHKYIWGLGPNAGLSSIKPVYCKDCKWLETNPNATIGYALVAWCTHISNIKRELVDSALWYGKKHREIRMQYPKDKNKNNDCPWHKEVAPLGQEGKHE